MNHHVLPRFRRRLRHAHIPRVPRPRRLTATVLATTAQPRRVRGVLGHLRQLLRGGLRERQLLRGVAERALRRLGRRQFRGRVLRQRVPNGVGLRGAEVEGGLLDPPTRHTNAAGLLKPTLQLVAPPGLRLRLLDHVGHDGARGGERRGGRSPRDHLATELLQRGLRQDVVEDRLVALGPALQPEVRQRPRNRRTVQVKRGDRLVAPDLELLQEVDGGGEGGVAVTTPSPSPHTPTPARCCDSA